MTNDPSYIQLSGFMLQLFGYLFTYAHPVLINAFLFDDLFLTTQMLRKWQTNRLFLSMLRFIALIRDYLTLCILDCFLFFGKYLKPVKINLTLGGICGNVFFTRCFPALTP